MRAQNQSNGTAGLREDICHLGETAEATSLFLLRQIEQKVESCVASGELARALAKVCSVVARTIREKPSASELDPDGIAVQLYDKTLDILNQKNEGLKAAIRGCERFGKHKSDLLDAYRQARTNVVLLFDAVSELKVAVMEHDADRDGEIVGSFASVEDLIASIANK